MALDLPIDQQQLSAICRKYHVARLELFGSRARGQNRPDSDVDLLVSFLPGKTPGFAFMALADELESLFAREVDLLVREDAERDRNDIRRTRIFSAVEPIFTAEAA
jgi:uncharacterized protein